MPDEITLEEAIGKFEKLQDAAMEKAIRDLVLSVNGNQDGKLSVWLSVTSTLDYVLNTLSNIKPPSTYIVADGLHTGSRRCD